MVSLQLKTFLERKIIANSVCLLCFLARKPLITFFSLLGLEVFGLGVVCSSVLQLAQFADSNSWLMVSLIIALKFIRNAGRVDLKLLEPWYFSVP